MYQLMQRLISRYSIELGNRQYCGEDMCIPDGYHRRWWGTEIAVPLPV